MPEIVYTCCMLDAHESIIVHPNRLLRKRARTVSLDLIGGNTISQEIATMREVLNFEKGLLGVALSAPQIGVSKRMFIIAGDLFATGAPDQIIINPEYVKLSKKTELSDEGCLSIPYFFGKVKRHKNVTIKYYDEYGNQHVRGAGGFLSFVIQHEMDHLDGVLFIDKSEQLEELKGADRKELQRRRANYIRETYAAANA